MSKKLFLLDGHALVYRAHYAFITRPLINSKGVNTSAITGFMRTLLDVMKKDKPTHLAVAFDLSKPKFRLEMFAEYKANRDAQPEDISIAIPWLLKILKAMDIPIVLADGYEADDVIGTLAKKAEKDGYQVYMMTPDKDFGQLVTENIFMYKPARMGNEVEVLGVQEILDRWDVSHVDQVKDMLGLQGDSVDNIPGIPGIGPKTAAILLKEYHTLEGIIANVELLKGKQQENVRNFAEQGILSKKLATIDINAPIEFVEENFLIGNYDRPALEDIFNELEFKTIAAQVLGGSQSNATNTSTSPKVANNENVQRDLFGNTAEENSITEAKAYVSSRPVADKNIENTEHQYILAQTDAAIDSLLAAINSATVVCFDTETTNIDPNLAELVGISFSIRKGEAWYVPVDADRNIAMDLMAKFKSFFENKNIRKVGQNIKYDIIILKWYGIQTQGVAFDTMIAHYLLEPDHRHNMDYLSETYLKYKPVSIETLIGKGKYQLNMRDISIEKVSDYAAEDADVTYQLYDIFDKELKEENLVQLFEDIEMPLVDVLADLEYEGIRVDGDFLNNYAKELAITIKQKEEEVYVLAGVRFNIGSPKQVGEVLFDRLKIPYKGSKTGKTDQYSTGEDKLAELEFEFPIARTILEYRVLAKLQSTYVESLPKMINPKTGRIHSSFNQALAATGRLSSNNPNLQNIPVRTPEGRRVREAFVAKDSNHVLLSSDYSQIELRLIAEISGDEAMLDAFQKGYDIHQATAAKVYGVPLESVSADQRRNAKTVNFSIIYGAGATNLSNQLSISRKEAKELIDQYFSQYTGLKKYMDSTVEYARTNGYVMTLLGRRRFLRDIDSRNGMHRSMAERIAVNTPIQGTAADMIKVAMININKALKEGNFNTKMILQVHDELLFDVPKDELDVVKPIIAHCMKTAIPNLKVPIEVGMGVGDNWLEAH